MDHNPLTLVDPTGYNPMCFPTTISILGQVIVDPTDGFYTVIIGYTITTDNCIDIPTAPPVTPPGMPLPDTPITPPPPPRAAQTADQKGKAFPRVDLCNQPADNPAKSVADDVSNAGTSADVARPATALGAAAAGASKNLNSPQATSFLGSEAASGLSKLGRIGGVAAQFGIAYDVLRGDFSSTLYDTADYFTYSALADIGAAGAVETLGSSIVTSGSLALLYYNAGGARGIVQFPLCRP